MAAPLLGARAGRLTAVLLLTPLLLVGSAGTGAAQEGPGSGAVPELPAPSEEPPPDPTPEPAPEPEPPPEPQPEPEPEPVQESSDPPRTRAPATRAPATRAPSSPPAVEQPAQEPVVDDPTAPPPLLPGATATPFADAPTSSPSPEPVAGTSRPADPLTRLVQLAVGGALLLLVGGVTGLYLTRESRGARHG